MKKLILTILILLSSFNLYGWDYKKNINFRWDTNNEFDGWTIYFPYTTVPEVCMKFENLQEDGLTLLMSIDFHPKHYAIIGYGPEDMTHFSINSAYSGNHAKVVFKYKFYIFYHEDFHLYDIDEEADEIYWAPANVDLGKIFTHEECIKRLEIYADIQERNPDYPYNMTVKYIELTELMQLNPEYEDYCEVYLVNDERDGAIDLTLAFYYGFPSQLVDIYIVFWNGVNIYFYPSMTLVQEKITLFLPQYTMNKIPIYFDTLHCNDLDLKEENYMTIGIAPAGTYDFFNELYLRHIYCQ